MNYFNHKNVQLAYEAVYNQDLCESMEDLGLIDDYDYLDEARQEISDRAKKAMARKARQAAFNLANQIHDPKYGIGTHPEDPLARKIRMFARYGGPEVKKHIKKGFAKGREFEAEHGLRVRDSGNRPPAKRGLFDSYELYDALLEYLLDEGYADTLDSAEIIIENMSEDWIDEILDEAYVEINRKNMERQIRRLGTASANASSPSESDRYSGMARTISDTYSRHKRKKGKPSKAEIQARISQLINNIRGPR